MCVYVCACVSVCVCGIYLKIHEYKEYKCMFQQKEGRMISTKPYWQFEELSYIDIFAFTNILLIFVRNNY